MKTNILTIIILGLSITLSAQNVKKGYKSLEKGDYLKAKESFAKNISENKDHVASNFGMAMVLADEKSPYFNIVDSWQYIEAIEGKTNQLNQEEIEILGEYFLETEIRKTSRPVKKKLDIAIEAVESRLIKYIREENDLDAVYAVLEKYPDFRFYDNVVHIRNQFEYRNYEKQNSMAGYTEFIEKFPDAAQVSKARQNQHKMAFEEAKTTNTVTSYNTYIKDYPDSKQLQQAMKLRNEAAFTAASSKNTLEAYEQFIWLYPDALQIPEARKYQLDLMYEKAKKIKTLEAYNEFIRKYPEGTYYVDVFNLKASDLGKLYAQQNGFTSGLVWSKGLDNNEQLESAKSLAITSDGGYIIAGTTQLNDTSYSDAWVVKLDNTGKMLWNKTIGQAYNDKIDNILITSNNEIIILGYTQIASDSAAYMGWMFKLGDDGSKKWNKNLGNIKVAASAITNNDEIYLSTFVNDTIPGHYYIKELNTDGQMEWERDYVRKGQFTSINTAENGNILLSGSQWVTYVDSKFYIKWEDTLNVPGDYRFADENGTQASLLSCDTEINRQYSYSLNGKKTGTTNLSLQPTSQVSDICLLSSNKTLVLVNNEDGSQVYLIDSSGNIISTKNYNSNSSIVSVVENKNGNVSYLLDGEDYILVTLSGEGI